MKELLVDLIDASAAKNPKLMLRRTESVVEKMLTNWMSICMYSCLRVRGAELHHQGSRDHHLPSPCHVNSVIFVQMRKEGLREQGES